MSALTYLPEGFEIEMTWLTKPGLDMPTTLRTALAGWHLMDWDVDKVDVQSRNGPLAIGADDGSP